MSESQALTIDTPREVLSPPQLLAIAVQQGADLDKLERLMDLQERWQADQARRAYNEAFAAFKEEAVTVIKNRTVTNGPLNGKKYAELFAVLEAVTPALSKHGLVASWRLSKDEKDWLEVTCTVRHVGGHSESVSMGGPPDAGGAKNAIQARASTVTYLERYTLKAILGVSEQEDDTDANTVADELLDYSSLTMFSPQAQKKIRIAAQAAIQAFLEGNEYGAFEEYTSCVDAMSGGDAVKANQVKLALNAIFKPHSALRASLKDSSEKANAPQ